jgi:large subunit ribosomal protein L30
MPEMAAKKKARVKKPARRAAKPKEKMLVIEQFGSGIGCPFGHKRTLRALGLRRIRQQVTRPDNPAIRGMVMTIPHLVRIVEA